MDDHLQPSKSQLEHILETLFKNLENYPQEFSPEVIEYLQDLARNGEFKSTQQIITALTSLGGIPK